MAKDPGIGYKINAIIVQQKGHCGAGHKVGDSFPISCHDSGGLCGFFYHDIFADLQTMQFGGSMPWWKDGVAEVRCPDPKNQVTLKLERSPLSA